MVIDFDVADNTRIYRLGDEAVGPKLEVEAQGSKNAPWSRLMYVTSTSLTYSTNRIQPIPRRNDWR